MGMMNLRQSDCQDARCWSHCEHEYALPWANGKDIVCNVFSADSPNLVHYACNEEMD